MRFLRYCTAGIFILAMVHPSFAETGTGLFPDRRKPQFMNDQGYYVFPMPYSIPGVGAGVGIMGIGMNVGGTYTDLFGFALAGGLPGGGAGISDIHIIPNPDKPEPTGFYKNHATMSPYSL